jgi:imidazolonepropionase
LNALIENIGQLITLAPLVEGQRLQTAETSELGIEANAWLAIEDGQVAGFGTGQSPAPYQSLKKVDAAGGLIMPGFVDAHCHLLFGGTRAAEFSQRLAGATYQEISAKGGGILSTVHATRKSSDEELLDLAINRAAQAAAYGITTLEVKTGYGLTVEEELRHLRIYQTLKTHTKQRLYTTCLALHAKPPEYPTAKAWADICAKELIPIVADQKLADSVDAFVEKGYFEPNDVETYLAAAKQHGLDIRLHADEFADSGAAMLAAQWKAKSADHLQYANKPSMQALAQNSVIAILLPGTSLATKIAYADAKEFFKAGCTVAMATDFNPGSCPIQNISLIATLGAVHCGFNTAQALTAITRVPAHSLGLDKSKGALVQGFDADFTIWPKLTLDEWIFSFGQRRPESVYIQGAKI